MRLERSLARLAARVSNLPSIALTSAHLTGWTGSLTRTPAWGHVVRRCPDASCSTARERRSAATGLSPLVWSRKVMPGRISRAWPSPANKRYGRRCGSESSGARAVRMSAVAKPLCEPVIDRCQKISFACEMCKCAARDEPRRTTAMKKHNHSSDDRPIQYRGKYSRHSRGQALTNFASDRHTGATCLKPSRRTIEALAPAPSPLVSLFLS